MKKLFLLKSMLLLCALIVGSGSSWAETVTFTFNTDAGIAELGISKPSASAGTNLSTSSAYTKSDVSFNVTNGTGTATRIWNSSGTIDLRIYNGSELTFTASGNNITSIVLAGNTVNGFTANVGTFSSGTWSGDAASVTLTATGTEKINTIAVTYTSDSRTAVNINSLDFSADYITVGGATATATAGHNTPACTTATFTYESLDEDIATCTSAGVITAVSKGNARIKATMSIPNDDPDYRVGTASITQTIEVKKAFHTATFYVNGASTSDSFEEDAAVTFPSDPSNIGGKTFVGWKKGSAIDGTTDVAPSFVTKASETMDDDDVDYYAVFATSATATVTKTDELDRAATGISNNGGYGSWSDKTSTSTAVYAGCTAGGNNSIQMNASTTTSKRGIITTTSGGKAKKVTVTWNSNSADSRSVTVYGSNSAYTSVSAFDSSKGTSLGSITKGTSTELSITGDYAYVGLYATSAIYLDKISIEWETTGTTYSAYCTSVSASVTVGANGYTTFASTSALDLTDANRPAGLKAYKATRTGATLTFTALDQTVPAGTGLLLLGETKGGSYNIPVVASGDAVSGNALVGVTTATAKQSVADDTYYFVMKKAANAESALEFLPLSTSAAVTIPAGKAYVEVPNSAFAGAAHELSFTFSDNETTGIKAIDNSQLANDNYFNLAGQRVAQPTKGLYIVNGKKVVIK